MRIPMLFAGLVLTARLAVAQGPSASDVHAQLARLTPTAPADVRLQVATWLRSNSASEHALAAIPALEKLVRKDPDAGVREQAVVALGQAARAHARPCPVALVQAIRDREDLVRWNAGAQVALFKTDVEPGSLAVLIEGARDDRAEVREHCVIHLGIAGRKDPKALAAIEQAQADPNSMVRHTAHCARFTATDDLAGFLAYLVRLREDPTWAKDQYPAGSGAEKVEQARYNLCLLGGAVRLAEWAEKRPDELAAALMKRLDDKSTVLRRGAANVIGAVARKVEIKGFDPLAGVQGGQTLLDQIRPPFVPEDPKTDDPVVPSKAAVRLRALKVEDRLTQLRDSDPDDSVREAAALALMRLAAVPAKK